MRQFSFKISLYRAWKSWTAVMQSSGKEIYGKLINEFVA